jgi:hypothetical protein
MVALETTLSNVTCKQQVRKCDCGTREKEEDESIRQFVAGEEAEIGGWWVCAGGHDRQASAETM